MKRLVQNGIVQQILKAPIASIIANNRVVFNIKGNDYRLIVHIRYDIGIIFIRFLGTHKEYDNVDATSI